MQVSTLRPGLLVGLHTSVKGNVRYRKQDIVPDHATGDGGRLAEWSMQRRVEDAAEHEESIKIRGKARSLITAICADSNFGLLCPEERKAQLDEAIRQARDLADGFNARAKVTRIAIHVIAGRIAADDAEAVRGINSDIRALLTEMEECIGKLDAESVRKAAIRLNRLGAMLSPFAKMKVDKAIDAARSQARRIVQAGETAAAEIDKATLEVLRSSRNAFLDLDEPEEIARPDSDAGRAVDFEPMPAIAAPVTQGVAIDF